MIAPLSDKPVRHILALSGGKDSSALATAVKTIKTLSDEICQTPSSELA